MFTRRTVLKLPLLATAAAGLGAAAAGLGATAAGLATAPQAQADTGRWPADRAHSWYLAQGWLVGANYITSNAINQLEMFQADTFDPELIDRELAMARGMGLNTVRVFLHDQLWVQDRVGFFTRLDEFVTIAASNRIKPLIVLFDSCWDPQPKLGRQRDPRPGVHNSGWVQSPGADKLGDRGYVATMRDYVIAVLKHYREDERILAWDLWNEPDNPAPQYAKVERKDKLDLVAGLLPQVFGWARSVNPVHPLTSGVWDGEWADPARWTPIVRTQLDNSDVITFHSYNAPSAFEAKINALTPLGRPIMCTEYLARTKGNTVEKILPILKRRKVGGYTWGFIAGKTQTYYPWDSWERPYSSPPAEWFHDLFHNNGKPYRQGEVDYISTLIDREKVADRRVHLASPTS